MIGGFERYYQIARCFRDEDSRADRLPEFTQLDIEMAFVEEDDVIELMEAVMTAVFATVGFPVPAAPWPRMTYAEAMSRFGSDRPDTRFGLELHDLGDALARHRVQGVRRARSRPAGWCAASTPGPASCPAQSSTRSPTTSSATGPRGWCGRSSEGADSWRSPVAKFLSAAEIAAINERLAASVGDVLFIVADTAEVAAASLGALRLELSRRFSLVPEGVHDVRWIVRFPMFHYSPDEGRWDAEHHPFTAPATAAGEPAGVADLDDAGDAALALLRPRARRQRDRRRLDP